MIQGHAAVLARLQTSLPPVSLFLGAESVGKWTTANWVRRGYGISGADYFSAGFLNAERSRDLVEFLSRSPVGSRKLAIVRLEKSSPQALNTLLKALEEIPDRSHVILISSHPESVPDTIRSRAESYSFGYLSPQDLHEVLVKAEHLPSSEAEHHARAGGGVHGAVPSPEDIQSKGLVLRALSAIRGHDAKTLESLSIKWDERCTALLRLWCTEALSQRWKMFQPEESEPMSTSSKLRILLSLKADIRPRLVVRSSLMTLLNQGL